MENKKVKRKLNKKALLVIILTLYLIVMIFYYVFTIPLKNITINGTNILKDNEIIATAGLSDYPKIFSINTNTIKKRLMSLDLVEDVVVKKNYSGTITIDVTEAKLLFYNQTTNKVVLSNGKEIDNANYLGIPALINYVTSDIYNNLIAKMTDIDSDIIALISEIEYSPDIKDDVTINDSRFILKMNDGNLVYIDLVNFANLNMYETIYSQLNSKGIIHLDSVYAESDTVIFTSFDKLNEEGDTDELSE